MVKDYLPAKKRDNTHSVPIHKTNADVRREIVQEVVKFQHDPLGFVIFAFPWGHGELEGEKLEDWQVKLLTKLGNNLKKMNSGKAISLAIREAVSSGHGIGKSAMVAWIIMWGLSTFEDTKIVVTANTETQLKTKTWAELAKWHRLCITSSWFKYEATSISSVDEKHKKTWRADMIPWSLTKTEAFAGLHNKGKRIILIFDEASAIDDKIWEVSEGALTDKDTEIIWLAFGNPTRNEGRFYNCFKKFKAIWGTARVDSRDVDISNKDQIKQWIDMYGIDSDFVKVRVRGLFPNTSVRQFISGALVDRQRGKHLRKQEYDFAPVIITVDPAWTGEDSLEIAVRQGLMFKILMTIPQNDNDMIIAGYVARFEDELKADAVFIDLGYGTGIKSGGDTMSRSWTLVSFGSASSKPGFKNKRAEMWADGKQWLKDGGVLPDDDELCDDLTGPEYIVTLKGEILLESKDDMKKRGLPSPNKADALMLSFAFPVHKKERFHRKGKEEFSSGEYEPDL